MFPHTPKSPSVSRQLVQLKLPDLSFEPLPALRKYIERTARIPEHFQYLSGNIESTQRQHRGNVHQNPGRRHFTVSECTCDAGQIDQKGRCGQSAGLPGALKVTDARKPNEPPRMSSLLGRS